MKKLLKKLTRQLIKAAVRSIRNTFKYDAPAIAGFVARHVRRPAPAKPAAPTQRPKRAAAKRVTSTRRGTSVAKPNKTEQSAPARPLSSGGTARQLLIRQAIQLREQIERTTSLADYQELSIRYQRTVAAIAALEAPAKPVKVKRHTRSGSKVRGYTRSAS